MKAELCKTCIHTNVCCRDKNTVGDRFVMGHPMFFDNDELFKKYKEWEAKGFPCDEYLAEPTEEQVKEYCRKRCLVILSSELFNKMKAKWQVTE